MSIPKARRGKVGSKCYCIRVEGRFIEIPKGVYDQLKLVTEERNFTEADIMDMVHKYNLQYNQIQRGVQSVQDSQPKPQTATTLRSPFGN